MGEAETCVEMRLGNLEASDRTGALERRAVKMHFLFGGPEEAHAAMLLAQGAGAPMTSVTMTAIARALAVAGRGWRGSSSATWRTSDRGSGGRRPARTEAAG